MDKEESRTLVKRTVKDSVFCDLFSDPQYILELYKSIHPEDTTVSLNEISSVTLENILTDQLYNDLGFIVGDRLLLLIECQARWSINIIIRLFMYLADTLQRYIEDHKLYVYGSKKIKLPKPELYMIYTGDRKDHPELLSLKDEYFPGEDSFIDVKVKVIYDGRRGDIINQYRTFVEVYKEQEKLYRRTRKAITETIRICKDRDVLREYLEKREKEVTDMVDILFDQEYNTRLYAEELANERAEEIRAESLAQGLSQGLSQGRKEVATKLLNRGMSVDEIAEITGLGVEEIMGMVSVAAK